MRRTDARPIARHAAVLALALASIAPFCALLGYLTPMLIDHESRGRPGRGRPGRIAVRRRPAP